MTCPGFHYRPERNWINDPNGLCQADGWYHLFFQYNPGGCQWGDIHWGHARSRDLFRWETLPVAMAPDPARGEVHCFSGGCCKDESGQPHFFYTSVGREEEGRGCADGAQQWMAEPTDAALTRLVQTDEGALTEDVHGGMRVTDWRDPCVLRWNGEYLMVLGGCAEGRGCVLLYTSSDMKKWTYRCILAQSGTADGIPWECPNLIPVDGKIVLLYSPCAAVQAMVGTLDEELRFHAETADVMDPAGREGFYAPQVFTDEAGRPIVLGWMPECDGEGSLRKGWSGVMSLPRLMHVKNGRLTMEPLPGVEGLAALREQEVFPGRTCLTDSGRRLLMWLECGRLTDDLRLTVFATPDGSEETVLTLTSDGLLTLDRSKASLDEQASRTPISRRVELKEDTALFLALDESTVECAVNGQWLSGRVYPTREASAQVTLETSQPCRVRLGNVNELTKGANSWRHKS